MTTRQRQVRRYTIEVVADMDIKVVDGTEAEALVREIVEEAFHQYLDDDDDVTPEVHAHERDARACVACWVETRVATEEVPHPVDRRLHTCGLAFDLEEVARVHSHAFVPRTIRSEPGVARRCARCGHAECPFCGDWCDVLVVDDRDDAPVGHELCCAGECVYDRPRDPRMAALVERLTGAGDLRPEVHGGGWSVRVEDDDAVVAIEVEPAPLATRLVVSDAELRRCGACGSVERPLVNAWPVPKESTAWLCSCGPEHAAPRISVVDGIDPRDRDPRVRPFVEELRERGARNFPIAHVVEAGGSTRPRPRAVVAALLPVVRGGRES